MADLLTFIRVILAIVIFILAISNTHNLTLFVILSLLAWTTDNLDGWFARKKGKEGRLAKLDFTIDVTLMISCFFYIVSLGFYSMKFFLIFALSLIVSGLLIGSKALVISFELLILFLILKALYREDASLILLVLLWAVISLLFHYNRFKRGVKDYVDGLKELITRIKRETSS